MTSGYTTLKKKNGDIVIYGGSNEESPEKIEIEDGLLRSFIEGLVEYLDEEELSELMEFSEQRLSDLAEEDEKTTSI